MKAFTRLQQSSRWRVRFIKSAHKGKINSFGTFDFKLGPADEQQQVCAFVPPIFRLPSYQLIYPHFLTVCSSACADPAHSACLAPLPLRRDKRGSRHQEQCSQWPLSARTHARTKEGRGRETPRSHSCSRKPVECCQKLLRGGGG